MTSVLIGSRALAEYDIILSRKEDHIQDWDYIMTPESIDAFVYFNENRIVHSQKKGDKEVYYLSGSSPIEIEVAHNNNSAEQLLEILQTSDDLMLDDGSNVVSPFVIYALKMSHRFLKDSPHFLKTMDDIHKLRSEGYNYIHPELEEWYKIRTKETYWYKHPSLAQNKKEFFSDDGVNYIYDHDTIHEAIKLYDVPAFELIKDDKAEVFTSKEKFYAQPHHIQIATVLEESYVLALERSLIPNNFKPKPEAAFLKALEKVCTSISSGYWRTFAWENYWEVRELYNENYVDKFKKALDEGQIAPYDNSLD